MLKYQFGKDQCIDDTIGMFYLQFGRLLDLTFKNVDELNFSLIQWNVELKLTCWNIQSQTFIPFEKLLAL